MTSLYAQQLNRAPVRNILFGKAELHFHIHKL